MVKTVSIIGIGRVGGALALAFDKCDYTIQNLVSRTADKVNAISQLLQYKSNYTNSLSNFKSDVIFIATPDTEIENTAVNLSKILTETPFIFHTSGSLSSEILNSLRQNGCRVGSFHPLVSISEANLGAKHFADAYFCLEGDAEAVEVGKTMVAALGGNAFSIRTADKPLYHAAAVVACGHFVALFSTAVEMLAGCGLDAENARKMLLPLVKSTVENLSAQTPAEALTGTFARADAAALQRHLGSLKNNRELLEIYSLLGKRSLRLAEKQGADLLKIGEMTEILQKIEFDETEQKIV
jgi:predicted short-subunit dehydrogenase-like oxidoreductase (DUF2520 family)